MNAFKQPRPAQAMNKVVPTFQARDTRRRMINQSICRSNEGQGRRTKKYLLNANTVE
jgi:hypothetical protein